VASAATRRKSSAEPFFGAILSAAALFIASGIIWKFSDAKFLLSQDIALVFLMLALTELIFRGKIWNAAGKTNASAIFAAVVFFAFVYLGMDPLRSAGFSVAYALILGGLRLREDVWACVLASWAYFGLAFFYFRDPQVSTMVFSIFFLSLAIYSKLPGRTLAGALGELGVKKEGLLKHIGIGVLVTFAMLAFFFATTYVLIYLGLNDLGAVHTRIRTFPPEVLASAVLLAPPGEELFFRGILFPALGTIGSSVVFAIVHYTYGSWVEMAQAFVIGIAYCVVYKKTGSLVPAIVSHALINALSIALSTLG
jgi:membrane protease YdiL (CAAX protease family)